MVPHFFQAVACFGVLFFYQLMEIEIVSTLGLNKKFCHQHLDARFYGNIHFNFPWNGISGHMVFL
jgi:hypothetical protein